jgi:flavin-dependent dehydrogenase
VKAAQLLGIDVNGIVDDVITGTNITFKGSHTFCGDSPVPVMYTLMRENFDHILVDRAQSAGADIREGVEALSIQPDTDTIDVTTGSGTFRGRFVVGADGATSRVAKAIGVNNRSASALCLTCRLQVSQADSNRWRSRIGIDIGRVKGGYGWVFPKTDHLSVGIACPAERAKGLKTIFREYLDSLQFERYDIIRREAALLPILTG